MITLVGNCQLHRLQFVMEMQGFLDYEYHSNTPALGMPYEPDLVSARVAEGGTVVAQAVMNKAHPLYIETLRALNPNIVFVPYLFIDGIFSLSCTGGPGSYAYGQDRVEETITSRGVLAAAQGMRDGTVDFGNLDRFNRSLAELQRREAACGPVRVSDYIQETYKQQSPVTTHNHPSPAVFDRFCGQVFRELGIPYRSRPSTLHAEQVVYAFSQTPRLFSPYDVEALGLAYPADDQWFDNGFTLLRSIPVGEAVSDPLTRVGSG